MEILEMLDWIVAMDLCHYKTEESPGYKPRGSSHWFIKGSPERFTSKELINIYKGTMSNRLRQRWNWALADRNR